MCVRHLCVADVYLEGADARGLLTQAKEAVQVRVTECVRHVCVAHVYLEGAEARGLLTQAKDAVQVRGTGQGFVSDVCVSIVASQGVVCSTATF
jgi:hypothetical protein